MTLGCAFECLDIGLGPQFRGTKSPAFAHRKPLPKWSTTFVTFHYYRQPQIFLALEFLEHVDDLKTLTDFIFLDELRHLAGEEWCCGGPMRAVLR